MSATRAAVIAMAQSIASYNVVRQGNPPELSFTDVQMLAKEFLSLYEERFAAVNSSSTWGAKRSVDDPLLIIRMEALRVASETSTTGNSEEIISNARAYNDFLGEKH